jgi:hypothetical protein
VATCAERQPIHVDAGDRGIIATSDTRGSINAASASACSSFKNSHKRSRITQLICSLATVSGDYSNAMAAAQLPLRPQ